MNQLRVQALHLKDGKKIARSMVFNFGTTKSSDNNLKILSQSLGGYMLVKKAGKDTFISFPENEYSYPQTKKKIRQIFSAQVDRVEKEELPTMPPRQKKLKPTMELRKYWEEYPGQERILRGG